MCIAECTITKSLTLRDLPSGRSVWSSVAKTRAKASAERERVIYIYIEMERQREKKGERVCKYEYGIHCYASVRVDVGVNVREENGVSVGRKEEIKIEST